MSVEVTGDVADYREVSDSLCIGVSTAEITGTNDWFDLGVTILAEGRAVPFAEVFTALALGQSHLLLPDGAYFSLDKPELRQLARLIEEARALQDDPGDQRLRISRFQAGLWEELTGLGVVERQARAWQEQVQGLLSADGVDGFVRVPPPGTLLAGLRPYQLDGLPVAGVPVAAPSRRHPRRRHGPGQDAPDAGADLPRAGRGAGRRAVPRRRPDQRRAQLGGRVRAVRPRPEGGDDHRHAGPQRRRPGRGRRGRRRRGDLVHAAPPGLRRPRGGEVVRADPGRGAVRQEPPVEDLPVRAPACRPRSRSPSPARRWRTT